MTAVIGTFRASNDSLIDARGSDLSWRILPLFLQVQEYNLRERA